MPWERMLACVSGAVEESLLLRVEYLIQESTCRNLKVMLRTDTESH